MSDNAKMTVDEMLAEFEALKLDVASLNSGIRLLKKKLEKEQIVSDYWMQLWGKHHGQKIIGGMGKQPKTLSAKEMYNKIHE